ncbi:uncharacterized protein K441DRAFT_572713, partial [Cenococcum geophilum 1.58]|uniref:uncharacterized protein n=1 Tax=Cenococcum geophilum 1.58 TaxID=794803 RepID=UPI00358F7325
CIFIFKTLAERVFAIQRLARLLLYFYMISFLGFWLTKSRSKVAKLKFCLKDVFGINDRLFDMVKFKTSSIKVAIIAITISKGALYILSNYNSVLERRKDCGKFNLSYLNSILIYS